MTIYPGFEVTSANGIATVAFDRVEHRNAVTVDMFDTFHDIVQDLAERDDLFLVVLTGNGSTFCPGADLRGPDSVVGVETLPLPHPESNRSAPVLRRLPQITVAAINGACAGAGLAWALACDLRIASASARFATAFLDAGLPGELGVAWTLTRALGSAASRELLLLPSKLSAEDARAAGLVHRVVDAEEFAETVSALVAGLAARGPEVLRAMKQNFIDADALPLDAYIEAEGRRLREMLTGDAGRRTMERLRERSANLGGSQSSH
jgi:2-(1,2-epoxy-1,2-dihydrophenyl)acetyl-CoA isomerase